MSNTITDTFDKLPVYAYGTEKAFIKETSSQITETKETAPIIDDTIHHLELLSLLYMEF